MHSACKQLGRSVVTTLPPHAPVGAVTNHIPLDVDVAHGFPGYHRDLIEPHIFCVVDDHTKFVLLWLPRRYGYWWGRGSKVVWKNIYPHLNLALQNRTNTK